jgi:GTP-binding protein
MPGYGYAKVSRGTAESWTRLLRSYLAGRPTLRRVHVLVDARHGLKSSDEDIMTLLDGAAVPYRIVLTKADETTGGGLAEVLDATAAAIARRPAAFPGITVTSARDGTGIAALRADLAALAMPIRLH